MQNPLISIIIVTFNAGKTLQKCLDSIYQQTYKNIEIIIIDGLSNDNTVRILKENEDKVSFWLSETDKGIYDAMNKALKYVKGDRIYFLGADDYLLSGFSTICYQLFDEKTIYLGIVRFKGNFIGRRVTAYSLSKGNVIHQGLFYPQSVFKKFKYNLSYAIFADYYLNIQCFKMYKFKFMAIPVADFSDGGVSSKQIDANFVKNKNLIILKHLSTLTYYRYLIKKHFKKTKLLLAQ